MDIKNVKENNTISPTVIKHWVFKFDKAISVLLKSGYNIDDLMERIRTIDLIEHEKNN